MKTEYDCSKCVNRGTDVCHSCTTTQSPRGGYTKPTNFSTAADGLPPFVKRIIRNTEEDAHAVMVTVMEKREVPLGLIPKFIRDCQRAAEIKEAIVRYLNANVPIPPEWVSEYNEIVKNLK